MTSILNIPSQKLKGLLASFLVLIFLMERLSWCLPSSSTLPSSTLCTDTKSHDVYEYHCALRRDLTVDSFLMDWRGKQRYWGSGIGRENDSSIFQESFEQYKWIVYKYFRTNIVSKILSFEKLWTVQKYVLLTSKGRDFKSLRAWGREWEYDSLAFIHSTCYCWLFPYNDKAGGKSWSHTPHTTLLGLLFWITKMLAVIQSIKTK